MLKGKLRLPDKARRLFPDRLGSLASFDDNEEGNGGPDLVLELGEELEIVEPNGVWLEDKEGDHNYEFLYECEGVRDKTMDKENFQVRNKTEKDGPSQVSVMEVFAADEKRSDLEYVLSQKEINLEKLKAIATTGLPDGGGLRATVWKLLLGYLPPSRDMWEKELVENRQKYTKLKEQLLLSPLERSKVDDNGLNYELNAEGDTVGPLERQEISNEDHPLSVGKASPWHQYFQEAMRNILLLFAKLNPAIGYVQGMNEVLAPLFYVFSSDNDDQNAANIEADSFSCFVRLLGESVDHFCQHLDNSPAGILSTLSRLADLLRANDEELWQHLEFTTKVKPQFYAFRWITLLLTQEFNFNSILRIWDSLLSNHFGIQDKLLRICCAMLLCVKSRLLGGDFASNLRLLQHYPDINIEHLLSVAQDLSPDASLYHSSL